MNNKIFKAGRHMLSLDNWRKRLIFWFGAVVVGMSAAGYAYVADYAQTLFSGFVAYNVYVPFVLSPIIFAVAGRTTNSRRRSIPAPRS